MPPHDLSFSQSFSVHAQTPFAQGQVLHPSSEGAVAPLLHGTPGFAASWVLGRAPSLCTGRASTRHPPMSGISTSTARDAPLTPVANADAPRDDVPIFTMDSFCPWHGERSRIRTPSDARPDARYGVVQFFPAGHDAMRISSQAWFMAASLLVPSAMPRIAPRSMFVSLVMVKVCDATPWLGVTVS